METCKNCGRLLIPYGGKCVYCGAELVAKATTIKQQKIMLRKYSIDIVFCVDGTYSMAPVLDSIKENIISFIDVCNDSKVDWRARVVVFRDSFVDEEWLENDNPFVSSKEDLVTQLGRVNAKGNVDEEQDASSAIDALFYAATKSDWRNIRFPGGPLDSDYKEFLERGGRYGFQFIVGFTDAKPRPWHPKFDELCVELFRYRDLLFAPKVACYKTLLPDKLYCLIVEEFEDPIEFYYHKELDFSSIYSVLSRTYS